MKKSKYGSLHHHHFDGLQENLQYVNNYDRDTLSEQNEEWFQSETTQEKESFRGGTLQECQNLTTYKDAELLKKVRDNVRREVASIQLTNVRRRVQFHKNKHVFVAERYHAGNKRAFATRAMRRAPRPVITIAVLQGYNANVDAEEALYNSIAGAVLAGMLQDAGYSVKIISVFSNKCKSGYNQLHTITLKDFHTYIDVDTVAMATSDPRFFRYTGFLSIVANANDDGKDAPYGYGTQPGNAITKDWMREAGIEFDVFFGQDRDFDSVVGSLKGALQNIEDRAQAAA